LDLLGLKEIIGIENAPLGLTDMMYPETTKKKKHKNELDNSQSEKGKKRERDSEEIKSPSSPIEE